MKVSGYSNRERFDAIRGAVMRYEEMCNRVDNGIIKSLHRDRKEIIRSKVLKGGYCASTWYLKNDTSSTIRCAPTPGGELAKLITRALNKEGSERTLVMENGGIPVTSQVRKNDPFFEGGCKYGDESCMTQYNVDCSKSGVIYEITCNTCEHPVNESDTVENTSTDPGGQPRHNYVGMTMTSVHNRMCGHLSGQKYKHTSNPLYRHDIEYHNGCPQKYTTRILVNLIRKHQAVNSL